MLLTKPFEVSQSCLHNEWTLAQNPLLTEPQLLNQISGKPISGSLEVLYLRINHQRPSAPICYDDAVVHRKWVLG